MSATRATPIVGRLAPSPTGHLHLGHARSFLLAWWHARSRGGRIVLRIEDLDVARVRPELIDETLRDLEWLGLDWDGEPWIQSRGLPAIEAAAQLLLERGLAYPCICTRGEIQAAQSAPHGPDAAPPYPGTCRGRFRSLAEAECQSGRPAALRFQLPEPPASFVRIEDEFLGPFEQDLARDIGDFPITRRAGFPAYQLAVVVDDANQAVTEIVRGADLIDSTPRQVLLQRALGLPSPRTWHVPLVTDSTGRRLAKRTDDLALAELRARGIPAETLVAWIARRSGFPTARRARAAELTSSFDMTNVPRTPLAVTAADLTELGL